MPRAFRYRLKQGFGVAGLIDHRDTCLGDVERRGVDMVGRPQGGVVVLGIEPVIHARGVVRRRD